MTPAVRPHLSKWWICGLLFLATTLNYMDRTALNQLSVRLESPETGLGLNQLQYSLLESRFALAFAGGALLIGVLADRVSVWWLYPVMVLGWSMAGFASGYATTFAQMLIFRSILGLFEAGNWPCGIRATRTLLKPEERSLGNAVFQSGTAIGAVVTPLVVMLCLWWADRNGMAMAWQLPFRVIGLMGVAWVVLWFALVPRSRFAEAAPSPGGHSGSFAEVLLDRRFWLLLAVIIAVNTPWHAFRVWLPKLLVKGHGYSENFMQVFSAFYYLAADMGSLTVGAVSLWLASRGRSVHGSRMVVFGACSLLTLSTLAVPFVGGGPLLLAVLVVVAFGSLGLFPTYFALSQELSARHQGKVTGTLGCLNALFLSQLFPLQGAYLDKFIPTLGPAQAYGWALAFMGLVPVVAFLLTWALWRDRPASG